MHIKTKTLRREGWVRLIKRSFAHAPFETEAYSGEAGLIYMEKVASPLIVSAAGETFPAAGEGFMWLQIAPKGENWWLTAMFDPKGTIVQYYFDVTLVNHIREGGNSDFIDLFLDVVMLPDGRTERLDQNELDEALMCGLITQGQHDKAEEIASRIEAEIPGRTEDIRVFCEKMAKKLIPMLRDDSGI